MVVDVLWQEVPEDGVIPDGTYYAEIAQCHEKDGDKGEWFELFWQIVEGQFETLFFPPKAMPSKPGNALRVSASALAWKSRDTVLLPRKILKARVHTLRRRRNAMNMVYPRRSTG